MRAKSVSESLNEMNFQKKSDPMDVLGIGRKKMIKDWLDEMYVKYYIINDDLTIDVIDNVSLRRKDLKEFPDFIQFNEINGYFSCTDNHLISLRGCPKIVEGYFACKKNDLDSLEGCPTLVEGEFYCTLNKKQFSEKYVRSLCDVKGIVISKLIEW